MASTATKSQGTQLYISNGTNWLQVKNIKNVDGLDGGTSTDIDVTNLDSTAKEYVQGLVDSGELSLGLDWDWTDAGQLECEDSRLNSELKKFYVKVNASTPQYVSFSGTVKSFPKNSAVDSVWNSTMSIRVSGSISAPSGTLPTP